MAIKKYKNIRHISLIDTADNWIRYNPTIEQGEIAFVRLDNNYIMVVGDKNRTPVGDVVQSIIDDTGANNNHVFFPISESGGSGGEFTLPPATINTLGGVMIPSNSGLKISPKGQLSSEIFYYDVKKDCYAAEKLHIENLSFSQSSAEVSSSGNTITLRKDNPNILQNNERAGLVIENGTDNTLFLGLDSRACISIDNTKGSTITGVIVGKTGVKKGFIQLLPEDNFATIQPFIPLNIIDNSLEEPISYDPTIGNEVDITPKTIMVNHQPVNYDPVKQYYDILLDGGLSEENKIKIDKLDDFYSRVEQLEDKSIYTLNSGALITAIKNSNSYTINHNEIKQENSVTTPIEYPVLSQNNKLKVQKLISDIKVDQYGHITQIDYVEIGWYIPNIK